MTTFRLIHRTDRPVRLGGNASRLLLALVAAVVILAQPQPVLAHAYLVRTSPAQGVRLASSPSNLELQFSEPVAGQVEVIMRMATGARVDLGPRATDQGLVAQYDVPPLAGGIYLVSWRAVALDGHLSVGEFAFGVGLTTGEIPSATGATGSVSSWPATGVHLLFILTLLTALGGLLAEWFVGVPDKTREIAFPAGWLLPVSLLGALAQVGWELRNLPGPFTASFLFQQRALGFGLLEIVGVAYGWWLLGLRGTRRLAIAPLSLAVLAAALAGHPGSFDPWWAAIANLAHLLAISVWLGGLLYVCLLSFRRRDLLRSAVGRYSRIGLVAALAAVLSGLVVGVAELGSPRDLVDTWYGRVLDVKVAVVATALLLALAARRRLTRPSVGPTAWNLSGLVRAEGVMVVVAIMIASVLATLPAPRGLRAATDLLGAPFPEDGYYQAGLAGNLAVYLAATEKQLQVRVVTPSGTEADGSRIELTGRSPDGTMVSFFPRPCGPGCVSTAFEWVPGVTTIWVDAAAPRWRGGRAGLTVDWPPPQAGQAALDQMVTTMRKVPRVDFVEHVTSGPDSEASTAGSMTGEQYMAQELYAAGGSSGVHAGPTADGGQAITLFVQGSLIWYSLEAREGRIQHEQIVSPGHLITRDFRYPATIRS